MEQKIVKVYRLDPKKFPKERKTILSLYLGTTVLLIIGAFAFITIRKLPLGSLWWLPIIVGLLIYYMSNAIQNSRRNINEYTLVWDGETVKQNTPGMPELTLRVSEISNLEITRQGLELSTHRHQNVLTIPANLSETDMVEIKDALMARLGQTHSSTSRAD